MSNAMKVYVASSWRNATQPEVVARLRAVGFEVYDFSNPKSGNGFHWSEIDPEWKDWSPEAYREALSHPVAEAGFDLDMDALQGCDICVLVLPSGKSAHLEAGYAAGAGKSVAVLMLEHQEPELMYKMTSKVCLTLEELVEACQSFRIDRETHNW